VLYFFITVLCIVLIYSFPPKYFSLFILSFSPSPFLWWKLTDFNRSETLCISSLWSEKCERFGNQRIRRLCVVIHIVGYQRTRDHSLTVGLHVCSKIMCSSTDCWSELCCVMSALIKWQEQSPACMLQFFPWLLRELELPASPAWTQLLSLQTCDQRLHSLPNSTATSSCIKYQTNQLTLIPFSYFNSKTQLLWEPFNYELAANPQTYMDTKSATE